MLQSPHYADWRNPTFDPEPKTEVRDTLGKHTLMFARKSQPSFPGDEDVPHVQH